jgi:hypothetical protein
MKKWFSGVAGTHPAILRELAEVLEIPNAHQSTFRRCLRVLLDSVIENRSGRLLVRKDAAFEAAEKKMREAKRAFDKLSEHQRDMIHLMIQNRIDMALRPEDAISEIVIAFARLTGKNPRVLPRGEGITRDFPFRWFVLLLRQLVQTCDGDLYPDPDPDVPHGGTKFGAVVDILKVHYGDFVPEKLPLSSIDEDWRRAKKSRHPPNRR